MADQRESDRRLEDRLFRLAFQESDEAVVVLTPDRRVFSWTRGAEELLGYPPEEAAGREFASFVPDEKRPSVDRLFALAADQSVVKNFDYELLHRRGVPVGVRLRMYSVREAGAVCAVLWMKPFRADAFGEIKDPVLHDTLMRLQQLSAIGQLTAALAHQIRTPLHVVQSALELIQEDMPPDGPAVPSLRMAERNLEWIRALSNAMSGFTHYKVHNVAAGDLNNVVEQVCVFVKMLCEKQKIRLSKSLNPLPAVSLDVDFLIGALYNLFANAIEAMPQGGELSVTTMTEGKDAVLIIADTGVGMDPEVLERVGRPFFTTKSSGTGLGLYVVQRILEQHKARLKIESRKGAGTQMTVVFPGA